MKVMVGQTWEFTDFDGTKVQHKIHTVEGEQAWSDVTGPQRSACWIDVRKMLRGYGSDPKSKWTLISDAPGESTVSPAGKLAQLNERMQAAARAHSAGHLTDELYEAFRKKILAEMEAPETIPAPKDDDTYEDGFRDGRGEHQKAARRAMELADENGLLNVRVKELIGEVATLRQLICNHAAYLGPTQLAKFESWCGRTGRKL